MNFCTNFHSNLYKMQSSFLKCHGIVLPIDHQRQYSPTRPTLSDQLATLHPLLFLPTNKRSLPVIATQSLRKTRCKPQLSTSTTRLQVITVSDLLYYPLRLQDLKASQFGNFEHVFRIAQILSVSLFRYAVYFSKDCTTFRLSRASFTNNYSVR